MQAEYCVELEEEADRLEIPWASSDEPSNRYYDLKASPELLGQIAEASVNLPLAQFLAAVNAPGTLFATAKCDTWLTEEFSGRERADFPAARTKFASYVDLVFSQAVFSFTREHYEQLARRLMQQLGSVPVPARAEFCLRHCYYHAQQAWGYYLTIFLHGYGNDMEDAKRNWSAGLEALSDALLRLSSILRQALQQIGPSAPEA